MDDETKKKIENLQKQISNQDKLASLGILSAGIVHEIQNPLNFVINFSKLSVKLLKDMNDILGELEEKIPEDLNEEMEEIMNDLKGNIQKIQENGERASDIIKGILLYSRGNDEFVSTDIKKLVKEYVWLSYHAIRANNKSFNVRICERYEDNLPKVEVIPQDFSRAIINIMNNACYAVFGKAKKASETQYEPTIEIEVKQEGEKIRISITDNGPGIPDEVIKELYTPFFTTKPIGEGTGLGLSITKNIIEEKHGGSIEMETQLNDCTRFTISLPIKK